VIRVKSFGDRIEPGPYRLHSRFADVVNFAQGGRLACVVAPCVGRGPLNIVVENLDFSCLKSLRVDQGGFALDETALSQEPRYDSCFPSGKTDPRQARANIRAWQEFLIREAHPKSLAFLLDGGRRRHFSSGFEKVLVEKTEAAARDIQRGHLESGARAMRGMGFGLTPGGDDFLAGYLWGLHARQRLDGGDASTEIERIYACGQSQSPLCSSQLRCAREGRCFERLRSLLGALLYESESSWEQRARKVLSLGETSGSDISVGLLTAALQGESP